MEPGFAVTLDIPAEAVAGVVRQLGLQRRKGHFAAHAITWHDTAEWALARRGVALAAVRTGSAASWMLERLRPLAGEAAVLGQAVSPDLLGEDLPADTRPVGSFRGTLRQNDAAGGPIRLVTGLLDVGDTTRAVAHLSIGGVAAVGLGFDLATRWATNVAPSGLAAAALFLVGAPVPGPLLGAPVLHADLTVSAAMALVCGHLAGVIRHYAPLAAGRDGVEPVHQMRVAVRRLRSALKLFHDATACPEMADLATRLRELGRVLGPARDWDVFVDGLGAAVQAAFPGDAAVRRLLAAAVRRRSAGYDGLRAYLGSAAFRKLDILLACCAAGRPWDHGVDAGRQAILVGPLRDMAVRALTRRRRRLLGAGDDIGGLATPALHAIRLQAKRLRYAAELFAPLYGRRDARRFLRRLSALQEHLGHLNDGAVAAGLMAELEGTGRGFAAGVVSGFVAGRAGDARREIQGCWRKLVRATPFWS